MAQFKQTLDPQRLFEAAEASLSAVVEQTDHNNGRCRHPADLMGTPAQPACLDAFTKLEIEEGCAFLVRLGVLEAPRRKRAA